MLRLRDSALSGFQRYLAGENAESNPSILEKFSQEEKDAVLKVFTTSLDTGISQLVDGLDNAGCADDGIKVQYQQYTINNGHYVFGAALENWKKDISHFDKFGKKKS